MHDGRDIAASPRAALGLSIPAKTNLGISRRILINWVLQIRGAISARLLYPYHVFLVLIACFLTEFALAGWLSQVRCSD
jgi:hypothetical protein